MKRGIMLVAVLAATASAAFLGRHEVRELRETRGLLAATTQAVEDAWTRRAKLKPALPASLTIQGVVVGAGAGPTYGTLTLRVGSAVSTMPISVSPEYSFVLSGAQSSDMVSVEIETAAYKYASVLGSYGKLVRHAGSDAHLTRTELDRTRLSAFSTSLYYFTQRILGGLPATDREYDRAIRSVLHDDLATAASALEDLADGDAVLPPGYANGYALLQDQVGYRAFLSQYGSGPFFDALMSAPLVPIRQGDLGINTELSGSVRFDDVEMFGASQILSQTSQGWTHYAQSKRNARVTPRFLASGELELTPQGDVYWESFPMKQVDPSQPFSQVRERSTLLRDAYRQLFVGEKYNLWAIRTDVVLTYPDYPSAPPEYRSYTGMVTSSKIDGPAYQAGEMVGQRVLPVFCKQGSPLQLSRCDAAVHRFNANGTGYSENVGPKVDANMQPFDPMGGEAFQWRSSRGGHLELTYTDTSVTYWRIDQGDEAVDVLAYVVRAQDGADTLTMGGRTAMINADIPGNFADLSPVGIWRYASFEQIQQPYGWHPDSPPYSARFHRNVDGTTVLKQIYSYDPPEGPYEQSTRFGWRVLDNMLYETRYRANVSTGIADTVGFSSCESAFARGATQCAPQQVRYFLPLARIGNRLYGIQEIYTSSTGGYEPPYAPVRTGSYPSFIEKE